jgi:hypothetical protein
MKFSGMSPVRATVMSACTAKRPSSTTPATENTQAPDRHDESRDPENAEHDPDGVQRVPEGELPGLTREDQHAREDRCDSGPQAGARCHSRRKRRTPMCGMQRGRPQGTIPERWPRPLVTTLRLTSSRSVSRNTRRTHLMYATGR